MTKGKPYKLRVHPMRDEQDEFVVEAEIVEDAEIVHQIHQAYHLRGNATGAKSWLTCAFHEQKKT